MSRYDGKPFLRLLELYVLNSIGELSDLDANRLRELEPGLRETYGVSGSWVEIVGAVMEFKPSLPDKIRDLWFATIARSNARGDAPDPEQFACAFVDANFAEGR
ncbi:hypothetical protein [Lysobacter hankyongensis]|uniref:Uncharacterized protein n=1 Tax=Lysobacter hankyongensis TaxID=1176535 RepID=A0ABP9AYR7_9GAMM